jgi:hypothetical protein
MSTASVFTLPRTAPESFSLWFQKGFNSVRAAATAVRAQSTPPSATNRQEADKLRAVARDMMRIDAGSAADMFAAADRHEFGHGA